jgi:hypothetical protein
MIGLYISLTHDCAKRTYPEQEDVVGIDDLIQCGGRLVRMVRFLRLYRLYLLLPNYRRRLVLPETISYIQIVI